MNEIRSYNGLFYYFLIG